MSGIGKWWGFKRKILLFYLMFILWKVLWEVIGNLMRVECLVNNCNIKFVLLKKVE